MTDEQITRALAEKVMGWVQSFIQAKTTSSDWPYYAWMSGYGQEACSLGSWVPLTSDADACAVLDKMTENGFSFDMQFHEGKWRVGFCENRDYVEAGRYGVSPEEQDRRRAICIAALKAVGAWGE
jgi:hypothetical protein